MKTCTPGSRFVLYSDNWAEFDGIYIDDISVDFYPESPSGDGGQAPSLPGALSLSQNFPNPFNPLTTIEVAILEGEGVRTTVRVHDLRGRRVRTLVDRELDAGWYRFTWDGRTDRGEAVPS